MRLGSDTETLELRFIPVYTRQTPYCCQMEFPQRLQDNEHACKKWRQLQSNEVNVVSLSSSLQKVFPSSFTSHLRRSSSHYQSIGLTLRDEHDCTTVFSSTRLRLATYIGSLEGWRSGFSSGYQNSFTTMLRNSQDREFKSLSSKN